MKDLCYKKCFQILWTARFPSQVGTIKQQLCSRLFLWLCKCPWSRFRLGIDLDHFPVTYRTYYGTYRTYYSKAWCHLWVRVEFADISKLLITLNVELSLSHYMQWNCGSYGEPDRSNFLLKRPNNCKSTRSVHLDNTSQWKSKYHFRVGLLFID